MSSKQWLPWIVVVLALVGLFDATYLTTEHYLGVNPTCFITTGCDTVLTSSYATIGLVPLSLLGVGYYLTILIVGFAVTSRPQAKRIKGLTILTSLGFLASLGLVYLQLNVIHAICAYCMLSAITSTLLWITSVLLWRRVPANQ